MAGQIGRGGSEALFKMRMIMRIENQICKEFGCRLTSADSSKALFIKVFMFIVYHPHHVYEESIPQKQKLI